MACLNLENLPVLVVSASDQNAAELIITEIINKDVLDESNGDINNKARIWRLNNKYYTAEVCLRTVLDGQELDPQILKSTEAHLIYLTEDECSTSNATEVVKRRMRLVPEERAHVRVVAADVAEPAAALLHCCAAARLELVPLREPPDPPGDDAEEDWDETGIARVRSAFHAHLWPGLVRIGHEDLPESNRGATDSSDEEWSEWCSGPRSDAEEAFAAALGSLPGAAAAVRGAARAAAGSREERVARAEDLVAAFCRALGTPLDEC